jgi:hypothetical protein
MPETPLDHAYKFALRDAFITASHTKLPTHTKNTVEATQEGAISMVPLTCPGSGQEPTRVFLENVNHPTKMTTINALCPGKCGAFVQWNYVDTRWVIRR